MTEPPSAFALQLRSLREAQGLSIRALADLIGVSSVTVWKWEKGGTRPRARLIPPLARALDVTPFQLSPSISPSWTFADARDVGVHEKGEGYTFASAGALGQSLVEVRPGDPSDTLANVIARAKQMIAEASGESPRNITIIVEY